MPPATNTTPTSRKMNTRPNSVSIVKDLQDDNTVRILAGEETRREFLVTKKISQNIPKPARNVKNSGNHRRQASSMAPVHPRFPAISPPAS
jgi:hypothetical protein